MPSCRRDHPSGRTHKALPTPAGERRMQATDLLLWQCTRPSRSVPLERDGVG